MRTYGEPCLWPLAFESIWPPSRQIPEASSQVIATPDWSDWNCWGFGALANDQICANSWRPGQVSRRSRRRGSKLNQFRDPADIKSVSVSRIKGMIRLCPTPETTPLDRVSTHHSSMRTPSSPNSPSYVAMIPTADHQTHQYSNRNSRHTFPRYRPANVMSPRFWILYCSKFPNMPPKHRARSGPIAEELVPRSGLALKIVATRRIIDSRTLNDILETSIRQGASAPSVFLHGPAQMSYRSTSGPNTKNGSPRKNTENFWACEVGMAQSAS